MNFKKIMSSFFIAIIIVALSVVFAEETYNVNVSLLKAYDDGLSMGNSALVSSAVLHKDGENAWLEVSLKPLQLSGMEGYLGELVVEGRTANVLSAYDVVDSYNDAENGTDAKMKGKKYPQRLSFAVKLEQNIYNCVIYVPVMGEMGFGNQDARIKIDYPAEALSPATETTTKARTTEQVTEALTSEVSAVTESTAEKQSETKENNSEQESSTSEESTSNEESTESEATADSYYRLPIKLWHKVEDKPSMGNEAVEALAYISESEGQKTLYLGSKKMQVANITSSLINLYYDDGQQYQEADSYAYDLRLTADDSPRPLVFAIPLKTEEEYLNLLIDPDVEPMGDEPIACRLKLDWDKLEKTDYQSAELIKTAETGSAKAPLNLERELTQTDKGITMLAPANSFTEQYQFFANGIKGSEFQQIKSSFSPQATIYAYRLEALGELKSIAYDAQPPINALRQSYQPTKAVEITLPLPATEADYKLYYRKQEEFYPLEYQINGEQIKFNSEQLGVFVLVKDITAIDTSNQASAVAVAEETSQKQSMAEAEQVQSEQAEPSNGSQPLLIIFFIILIAFALLAGIYYSRKYYKALRRELSYGEELKVELLKKKEKQDEED